MRKFKLFNGFVLGLVCILIFAGCESKVLVATPTANAGPDQNVAKSATVTLDGSGSVDPNADPLTYLWTMDPLTGKPALSTAVLSDVTAVAPTFTADLDGTYTITLVVSDGATNSGVDTVVISVSNTSPVAVAGGPSPVDKHPSNTVALNSVGSMDANGDPITYLWTMDPVTGRPAGSTAVLNDTTVAAPTFIADVAGTYSFSLVVNDGTTNSNTATVDIIAENTEPVAIPTISVPTIHTGQMVTLDGSTSTDINLDSPLSYAWTVTSNPGGALDPVAGDVVSPTFIPTAAGNYVFSLVVTDNDPFPLSSSPVTVALTAENAAPVADAEPAILESFRGATVQLDGAGSYDPDAGDAIYYAWTSTGAGFSFSDSAIESPTFTSNPAVDDVYTITLTVSDDFGGSSWDTITLTTTLNQPPTADAGPNQNVTKSASVPVILDGSLSDDPNGDTLTYVWTFASVPVGSSVTDASLSDNNSTTAVNPTFTADFSGAYDLSLTVNDSEPLFSAPTPPVTITVTNDPPVADAGVDLIVAIGTAAILDGIASSDPNGDALNYTWTFTSVPTIAGGDPEDSAVTDADLSPNNTSVAPTFDPDEIGDYTLSLVVTDNEGLNSLVVEEVVVSAIIPVVDTGQTVTSGNPGEDADYGSIYQPSYTDPSISNDGTVTDIWTGLIWQQPGDFQIANWYGATGTYNDPDNLATTDVCASLGLAGHTWRLPTRKELASVVNYGITGPAVDPTYFPSVAAAGDQYWSSDSLTGGASEGWLVDLSSGSLGSDAKDVDHFIICVSGDPLPGAVLGDNGDGTVTDTTTSLVWQQVDDGLPKNWSAALASCATLSSSSFAGYSDWRLPNIRELASITDLTVAADLTTPSISQPPFTSASSSNHYWSSTYALNPVGFTWVVDFNGGDIVNLDVNSVKMSRCVRGGQ